MLLYYADADALRLFRDYAAYAYDVTMPLYADATFIFITHAAADVFFFAQMLPPLR